jgi:TfoX/Sxy family transcriptional regulator of competence genes
VGAVERDIRDRAAESLIELRDLEVRPMNSGFGFYLDGLLVAAAWDGAFRLRYRTGSRWVYNAVDEAAIDDPNVLVRLVSERAEQLSQEPQAKRRR